MEPQTPDAASGPPPCGETAPTGGAVRRRALIARLVVGAGLLAAVIGWGSDRRPADATRPVIWRSPSSLRPPAANELRIASFNIHSGKGGDNRLDLARTASELEGVDFAGLFEVRADPWGDQAAELGARLGMRSTFLGTERRWWHDHFGNAVLSTRPVAGIVRIPLVGTRGKAYRQAVLAHVPLEGRTVQIVMAHIDREQDREEQMAAVIRLFRALEPPAVLMGDLNSHPLDPQLQGLVRQPGVESVLHSRLGDAIPPDNIDWLIIRGLECTSFELGERGASDHPAIRATLRIGDASAERR